MEPITLCGALILAVGLWLEYEAAVIRSVRRVLESAMLKGFLATPAIQKPVYAKSMNTMITNTR